ncbi:hypothetical protein D2A34_03180 [Clostridium chromiireducens]|uniref:Uncharacterized protein n=1 Tax=Clostridium chromiireducens TaxID=225345 RepID=A0A399ITV9_9CLOT|nr:hypothetical protein [Clostridium chromiireducens]RII36400.1 hypothetical protein D2A34_03180 [Clostridium chromiireducens]
MNLIQEKTIIKIISIYKKTENIEIVNNNIANDIQETSAASEKISAPAQEVDPGINVLSNKALEGRNVASKSKERAIEVRNKGIT